MTHLTRGLVTVVVIAVAVSVQTAFAQTGQSTLTGKVTDATGAVIVGATITAVAVDGNSDGRLRREAATAADGTFVLDRAARVQAVGHDSARHGGARHGGAAGRGADDVVRRTVGARQCTDSFCAS